LKVVINNVAEFLQRAGRLQAGALSPHWKVSDQPEPVKDPAVPLWVKVAGSAGGSLVILLYVFFNYLLVSELYRANEQLLR
jgi:type VI protein secretion system component VasF